MKAINILWDVDYDEDMNRLPKEIDIPPEITDEDEISDYLSDVTGFCHEGFDLVHPKDEFEYHGFHFVPLAQLPVEMKTKQNQITLHLKSDHNLGFSNYEWGKIAYSYDDFYAAHGYKVNDEYYYDLFLCKETGKTYIPGENELFEWVEEPKHNEKINPALNTGNRLVKFVDILEENNMTPHYGILLPDKTIICFCCGGIVSPKDYVILEDNIPWQYLDETTKEYL